MKKNKTQQGAYLRILGYAKKYKYKFIMGIFFSLWVSVFNGLSLTSLKPIFDVLETGGEKPFQIHLDKPDIEVLVVAGASHRLEALIKQKKLAFFYKEERDWLKESREKIQPAQNLSTVQKTRFYLAEKKISINEYMAPVHPMKVLTYVSLLVIPIYLLKLISDILVVYFLTSTGLGIVGDIRKELYENMVRLPLSYFMREKTGILMSRIINDVGLISESASNELRTSINNFFIIVTHLILLSMISLKLLLITFIGVPLILLPISHFAKKIKEITGGEQSRLGDLNGHLQEVISGIRVIRAFGMEKYEGIKFDEVNTMLLRQSFRYRINHALGPSLVEFTTSGILVGMIIYGSSRIIDGELSSGSFFLFLFTLLVILSPIKQMATWANTMKRTTAAGERIFEMIDMSSEAPEVPNPKEAGPIRNEIHFDKVTFSYPNTTKKVLNKISFKAPVGSTVALVGHSGAGKSTLVDLIPRFYDPVEGAIKIDGLDIRTLGLKNLRDKIGVVTQDIFLFNGTVKENIAYGRADITEPEITRAAKLAFADVFISQLPNQYETHVGERGLMLSGGQRQRISIARALLKNPEILILDEATSALDTQSERLVQKALETLMRNRTTFVIAHRLSTIYNADLILVLDKGRIVEHGTHKTLVRKKGHYKKLYDMQFREE